MGVFTNLLLWLHLAALGMGMGGGLAMSQIGPRLVRAGPEQRETWWPVAKGVSRISAIGMVLLLVTGPLMLWLKYGGFGGLNVWFHVKLALVVLAAVLMGLSQMGMAKLRRGDEAGGRLMMIAGPLTGLTTLGVILAAVFAFD